MIKRERAEGLLKRSEQVYGDSFLIVDKGELAELCRTWLRVNDAPTGHLRDSIDFDGDTGMDESHARALVGQRIRLVPEADSGGDRG